MHAQPFSWPTKEDYDMAMEAITENMNDPDLKKGRVKTDKAGIHRFGGAGLYTTLYRIDNTMIRCFCKTPRRDPPDDIVMRYRYISAFTQRMQHVPNLIPVTLVEGGIQVAYLDHDTYVQLDTKVVPFVKMPFISGQSLGSFVFSNLGRRERMEKLCTAWFQLIRNLDRIRMAHGDLDLTNAIVTEDSNANLTLKLIDYDNTWIPELAVGYEQTEAGHDHFQHPAFNSKQTRFFNAEMDRFSALVIYISLKVITHSPYLYRELGADDTNRLLLDKADYVAEMKGERSRIKLLHDKQIPDLETLLDELCSCLRTKSMPRRLKDMIHGDTSAYTRAVHIHAGSSVNVNRRTVTDDVASEDGRTYEVIYDAWDRVVWSAGVPNLVSSIPQRPSSPQVSRVPPVQSGRPVPNLASFSQSAANQQSQAQSAGGERGGQVQQQLPYSSSPHISKSSYSTRRMVLIVISILLLLLALVGVVILLIHHS